MIAFPTVAAPPTPPAAPPVQPVTEDYFGTKVTDNYRYMEDPKNQVANDWIRAEGHYTRALLDSIPGRAAVAKQIAGASGSFGFINTFQSYGGRDFWLERVPGSDNYDLMVRDSAGKRKLVDLCGFYQVVESGSLHSADVDVVATLDVLERLVGRFPHLADLDLDTLHEYQVTAHQAWAEGFNAWRAEKGLEGPGAEGVWPVREPVGTLW